MKRVQIIILAGIVFIAACGKKEEKKEAVSTKYVLPDTMQHMITVDTVRNCNISDQVTLTGDVSANENSVVKIFPRSSGQVVSVNVSLGDHVSKGQVLATIRSADIAGSYSDLSSTDADVSIAKRQMDNTESLYKSGISSEREYNEAKQNYQKALAARSKVQSVININGGNKPNAGGTYTLTSPIDGYITEKKVNAGNFIRSDAGDNLMTVSNLQNVWVYAYIYEADIRKVKEGYTAEVHALAYPDKTFFGKVDKISEVLDPQSKALRARINIDNKEMLLKPDMFAKVVISNQEGVQSVCVPTAALIPQDTKNYVILYNAPDDIKVQEVEVIKTVDDKTFVKSGVTAGQKVITKYQNLVFSQLTGQ